MTESRARAEYDYQMDGPAIYVRRDRHVMVSFEQVNGVHVDPERPTTPDEVKPLRLDQDTARAIYEALADYFGGMGHDTRALRADYDAERKRVDRLMDHLIATPTTFVAAGEVYQGGVTP